MNQDILSITNFLHTVNKLKRLLRFKGQPGWEDTSIERWESVAEHSYRLALMAVMYHPYIETKPNLEKTLKMILVHDIVEIMAEDYSPMKVHNGAGGHAFDQKAYEDKHERESVASETIFGVLPDLLKKECIALWKEYSDTKLNPEKASAEGKYAYALDKLEATMQIIDWKDEINTWNADRTNRSFKYINEWSKYDKTLFSVANLLKTEMEKMEK